MRKIKPAGNEVGLYDVCHPAGNVISAFCLCPKHGKDFMKKWKAQGYQIRYMPAPKDAPCDICPEKEII